MRAFEGRVLLITSIFIHNPSRHAGSFDVRKSNGYITHLEDSPLFCDRRVTSDNTRTVVLTDDVRLTHHPVKRTKMVLVPSSNATMETNSYRFLRILRHIEGDGWWTHAYTFDASDVTVLQRPPVDIDQLSVGVDHVDHAKGWLRRLMVAQNYTPSTALQRMLADKKAVMYKAGNVGGSRHRLLSALRAFRRRSLTRPLVYDTIHVNEIFVHNRTSLTLGYPHGPLHLPFRGTPKGCFDQRCRHVFLRNTMGYYWFGHKIPRTWISLLRPGDCKKR